MCTGITRRSSLHSTLTCATGIVSQPWDWESVRNETSGRKNGPLGGSTRGDRMIIFRFLCVHCHDSCETVRARVRPRSHDYLYLYRTDDCRRAADKSTRQRLRSHQPVARRRLSPPSAATKSARDGALGRGRTEAPARGLAGAYTGERRAPLLDARSSGDPRARGRHSMHGCTLCAEPAVPAPPRPLHRIGSRRHASRVASRI